MPIYRVTSYLAGDYHSTARILGYFSAPHKEWVEAYAKTLKDFEGTAIDGGKAVGCVTEIKITEITFAMADEASLRNSRRDQLLLQKTQIDAELATIYAELATI